MNVSTNLDESGIGKARLITNSFESTLRVMNLSEGVQLHLNWEQSTRLSDFIRKFQLSPEEKIIGWQAQDMFNMLCALSELDEIPPSVILSIKCRVKSIKDMIEKDMRLLEIENEIESIGEGEDSLLLPLIKKKRRLIAEIASVQFELERLGTSRKE